MKQYTLPLSLQDRCSLRIYDHISLSGSILVGRDKVHQKLEEMIRQEKELPVSLINQAMYYMGPARKKDGDVIGSCGPTTSARMDSFTPLLMEHGLSITIGKGPRSVPVIQSIKKHQGLYLVAFGGCGALYSGCVKHIHPIAFEELGPEALIEIVVEDFPVIVGIDSTGNSTFF